MSQALAAHSYNGTNRFAVIANLKKELLKVDDDLQAWLVHNEKIKDERIRLATRKMSELKAQINFNEDEIRRERVTKR